MSLVDKVSRGTYHLASIIVNFAESPELDKVQSSIQFNLRRLLQLINYISSDLQKLLRYFNGTTILVFFKKLFPSAASAVFPTRVALYLNDSELSVLKSALLAGTSSLLNCHKLPDISE